MHTCVLFLTCVLLWCVCVLVECMHVYALCLHLHWRDLCLHTCISKYYVWLCVSVFVYCGWLCQWHVNGHCLE